MSSLYRRDDWSTDGLGRALSGLQVYVCYQPADTESVPPSPLATIYSDNAGADPITQPVLTDGFGHSFWYAPEGSYTIVFYSPLTQEVVLEDQALVPYASVTVTYKNDTSNAGSITGSINGTNRVFTLSGAPAPPNSLMFMVNGLVQAGWSLSGSTVTLAVAPHSGDILNAIYQIAS